MNADRVHLTIAGQDLVPPRVYPADGHARVPLQPICAAVGADWISPMQQLFRTSWRATQLGLVVLDVGGQATTCIRVDRVAAFLNGLSTYAIRDAGCVAAANWLEAKHAEWANDMFRHGRARSLA